MDKRYLQREGPEEKERIQKRYEIAIKEIGFEKNDCVSPGITALDAGCGQGFGMEVLSEKGFNVVGVDVDLKAYDEYKKQTSKKGIFILDDITSFETPLMNKTFNYIFAVEIIEHLDKPGLLSFLTKAFFLLKDEGKLVIVMPQRRLKIQEYPSGYHVIEYKLPEFLEIMKSHDSKFKLIKFLDKELVDRRSDLYVFQKK